MPRKKKRPGLLDTADDITRQLKRITGRAVKIKQHWTLLAHPELAPAPKKARGKRKPPNAPLGI